MVLDKAVHAIVVAQSVAKTVYLGSMSASYAGHASSPVLNRLFKVLMNVFI